MADGQPCRPVSRRKRQVQRQIDHALLGGDEGRDGARARRSGAVDVLAPTGPVWMTNGRGPPDFYGVNEDAVGYA